MTFDFFRSHSLHSPQCFYLYCLLFYLGPRNNYKHKRIIMIKWLIVKLKVCGPKSVIFLHVTLKPWKYLLVESSMLISWIICWWYWLSWSLLSPISCSECFDVKVSIKSSGRNVNSCMFLKNCTNRAISGQALLQSWVASSKSYKLSHVCYNLKAYTSIIYYYQHCSTNVLVEYHWPGNHTHFRD